MIMATNFGNANSVSISDIPMGRFFWSAGGYGIKVLKPKTNNELYRLAVLYIPKGTIYFKCTLGTDGGKCRAQKAEVVKIAAAIRKPNGHLGFAHELEGDAVMNSYFSTGETYTYRVGETMRPEHEFDLNPVACASGIHFFEYAEYLTKFLPDHQLIFGFSDENVYEKYNNHTVREIAELKASTIADINEWYGTIIIEDERRRSFVEEESVKWENQNN